MTIESKGQGCTEDPQQVAFQQGVSKWVSGEITYNELRGLLPSCELLPHERIARTFKQLFKKFSNPQH
jgi:hypothetical protein